MTAVAAWVRSLACGEDELVIASDSRLTGGKNFDAGIKILPFSRGDCALAFSGSSDFAYPLMLQLTSVVDSYRPARTRDLDINSLRNHLPNVFNNIIKKYLYNTIPDDIKSTNISFIFCGYSSCRKRFEIFVSKSEGMGRFKWENAQTRPNRTGLIAIIGDRTEELWTKIDNQITINRTGSGRVRRRGWKWEPLAALRDMCREAGKQSEVGGAVQITKLHQHIGITNVPVYWPNRKDGGIHINGRALLPHERTDHKVMDLDTFTLCEEEYRSGKM